MNILFIDTTHPSLWEGLCKNGFTCKEGYALTLEEIKSKIGSYEGVIIRSRVKFTKEIIDACTHLKFIARVGAGLENIDVAYAESKGIKCLHAPEGNRDAVAEHAIGMLLSLFNNLNRADKQVREGKWIREGNRGLELAGKTVGIIGFGNMGSAFAQRLSGFGVTVLAYDKYKKGFGTALVKEASMEDIFNETDVLSIHLPLTEETAFIVNDTFINKFKKSIYIINTSRGKCLNTADLIKNLKSGKVLGACLDVLEYEDISFEQLQTRNPKPETLEFLIQNKNVLLTPHIAGWTHESNKKMAEVLLKKIIALNG